MDDRDEVAAEAAQAAPADGQGQNADASLPQVTPAKPFDIFEFVQNIKCPPRQKDVIGQFDEAAGVNPHQILHSIFTFLRTEGVSEGDKILVLNMGHELLFAYFDEHVDPLGEREQQMALEAMKMVYADEGTSVAVRRELNNVVSLIWKISEEIDVENSPNQVANFAQLLRYCLSPATHTAANSEEDRYLLAELGLTLFSRIMHEILLPYLLSHEEGEDDEGPAHYVEKALFPLLSDIIPDTTAPLSLRVAAIMVITNSFSSELPSCLSGFITLNTLVPHIVRAIPELYSAHDYDKLEELLRSFEHLSLPFVAPHIPIYTQTLVSLATTPFVPGRLRSAALQPLINLSSKYANLLGKEGNLLRFLVWHLMYLFLLAEPRKEELSEGPKDNANSEGIIYEDDTAEEDDEHHGKDSPTAVAGWALSAFIRAFGHETIAPICLGYIGQYFKCEREWQYPHAALRALASLVQAYGRVATPTRLDPLVLTVVHYFQHPNISLRVAAAVCLGRLAKHVPGFARKFSRLLMPVFKDRLKDPSVSVLITTCRAMTHFFQNISKGLSTVEDDYEDENDDPDDDAEDQEADAPADRAAAPAPIPAPALPEGVASPAPGAEEGGDSVASVEEDLWPELLVLVQGLTDLVKEGSGQVKEHAVTALFNITQLSSTVLQAHLPQLVALCLYMLNRKVAPDLEERANLRTIGRVFRCTTQIGMVAGKKVFQADALKFVDVLVSPNHTVERLLQVTPSYVASALGRIALCLKMDFAPYLGLFFNVMERSIPCECGNVILMTEDRPIDMDGWEVAESVDDFGGVQKVYVNKREIRDKRLAINSLGSVIALFADSNEGARHFYPYVKRAQAMLQRMLWLVDNNFEVMGMKELAFSKHVPLLIRIFKRAKDAQHAEDAEERRKALKATIDVSTRAVRGLLPHAAESKEAVDVASPPPAGEDGSVGQGPESEPLQRVRDTDKGKDKLGVGEANTQTAGEGEDEKREGDDDEVVGREKSESEPDPNGVTLSNLVEPLWQELANAWERAQEPKKSMELLYLWDEMMSAAKGECLGAEEVHAASEYLLSVLYDCDHYMSFEGKNTSPFFVLADYQMEGEIPLESGASLLAGGLIPQVMEGLMQYHPKAFEGAYLMNHLIPTLQHDLESTAYPATQLGCLLMLDSVLDFMPQPMDYVHAICPLLLRFVLHPDAAVSQAACYGVGVCAKLTTPETDKTTSDAICQSFSTLQQATIKWHARAQKAREQEGGPKTPEQWVCDNAMSAQAKVFCRHYYNMPNLTGAIDAWLEYLPLRVDTLEMVEVMEILCGFIKSENLHVRMFIASRQKTVARALVGQLNKFNRMVKLADHMQKLEPLLSFIHQFVHQALGS